MTTIGLSYSLVKISTKCAPALLFTRVEQNILTSALSLTLIFGLGLLLTLWVIRTWIVRPLNQLTRSMEEATDLHDFGHRLEGDEGDEIGRVALAYNQMLDSVERQLGKRPAPSPQDEKPTDHAR